MSITIESPTAEAAFEALQKLPLGEMERLRVLLIGNAPESRDEEEDVWRAASDRSAARFFDEEESA